MAGARSLEIIVVVNYVLNGHIYIILFLTLCLCKNSALVTSCTIRLILCN